jgi:hypothetical protein
LRHVAGFDVGGMDWLILMPPSETILAGVFV